MLSSSSAFARSTRCLRPHSVYVQSARFASRLSSIKRGIQGETSAEPRRFGARPSRPADKSFPDGPQRLSTRSARRDSRPSSDEPRKFSSRRDNDIDSDKPRRFSDRSPPRGDDRSIDESRRPSDRSSRRNDDLPKRSFDKPPFGRNDDSPKRLFEKPSFARNDDSPRRSFGKPSFGRNDDAPKRSFDKSSFGRNDDAPRRSFDKPSFGRSDDRPRRSFDRPTFGKQDDDTRRPFDRSSRARDEEPRRSFTKFSERKSDDKSERRSEARRHFDGVPPQERSSRPERSSRDSGRDDRPDGTNPDTFSKRDNDYISVPYTTAASEFLYGLNVVYAALKSRRRSLYTLYLHSRAKNNVYKGVDLERLANGAGVKIRRVENNFLPTMDKMTDGRPHNGVILEASPLPVPAVEQLGKVEASTRQAPMMLSRTQTAEDRALHGTSQLLPTPSEEWRAPLVLMLDGILDPGNLGNILRTAYFYGVDAVAICVNTCAPLTSSVVHKAASGATEALNILAIQRPADFVSSSARNGWRVHAAVAPEAGKQTTRAQFSTNKMVSPLSRAPSILMMGAEGEGLRLNLKTKASYHVVIAGEERSVANDLGVDSLNVGAATAVLIEAFMRPPIESRASRMERAERADKLAESKEEPASEKIQSTIAPGEAEDTTEVATVEEVKESVDDGKLF